MLFVRVKVTARGAATLTMTFIYSVSFKPSEDTLGRRRSHYYHELTKRYRVISDKLVKLKPTGSILLES